MEKEKQDRLEAVGYKVGTVEEFLSAGDFEAKSTSPDQPLKLRGDELWWGTGQTFPLVPGEPFTGRKLSISGVNLSPYTNPIASLRSERKIKSGKAAKLLGISRQRLHKVEHAQRELPCMERLLEKAQRVWREEA